MSTQNLLVELFVEELPPKALNKLGVAFASVLAEQLKDQGLAAADAAWSASRRGIQVHGAMGYTWEVDLQMFMKRAWVLDAAWGDRGFHKARLGEALLADDAPLGPATTLLG